MVAICRQDFKKASQYYSEAVKIYEKILSKKHPLYIRSLIYYAGMFAIDNKAKFSSLLSEAEQLMEEHLDKNSIEYFEILDAIGWSYGYKEKEKAVKVYVKARNLAKRLFGESDPRYVRYLNKLTDQSHFYILREKGQGKKIIEEAFLIQRKTGATNTPDYARTLYNNANYLTSYAMQTKEIQDLQKERNYAQVKQIVQANQANALKNIQEATAILESTLGKKNLGYIEAMIDYSLLYQRTNKREKAKEILENTLVLSEKLYGMRHPKILFQLQVLLYNTPDIQIQMLQEALSIWNVIDAPKSTIAGTLRQIAGVYLGKFFKSNDVADFKKCEEAYLKAVQIYKEMYGENSVNYANMLSGFAGIYNVYNKEKGIEIRKQVADIKKRAATQNSIEYAQSLEQMAQTYISPMHNYAKAKEILLKVVKIKKELLGEKDLQYLLSVEQLANVYYLMGEYGEAVVIYKNLIAADKENDRAFEWNKRLSKVYMVLGEYDASEEILQSFLDDEKISAQPLTMAPVQEALGGLYYATGRYDESGEYYRKSRETLKNGFPGIDIDSMPGFGTPKLFGMAIANLKKGEYEKAEELLKQLIETEEKHQMGSDNPTYVSHILGLAELYFQLSRYEEAEPILKEAVSGLKTTLGDSHPAYSTALMQNALMYGAWDKPTEAFENLTKSLSSLNIFIEGLSLWASENRLQAYLSSVDQNYDYFYSLLSKNFSGTSESARKALDMQLAYEGRVLDLLTTRNRLALMSKNSELSNVIRELKDVTQHIAHLSLVPPKDLKPEKYKASIAKLESKKQNLEETLARGSAEYSQKQKIMRLKADDVVKAMPKGSVYLNLVDYKTYDYLKKTWTGERNYLAFLLKRDDKGSAQVRIEDLGPAEGIDNLVINLRKILEGIDEDERGAAGVRVTDASSNKSAMKKSIVKVSSKLYEKVLSPFSDEISKASALCIAPSGTLNLLPFEVLIVPEENDYLCDRISVIYTLGRDLYAAKTKQKKSSKNKNLQQVYVVAGPDYSDARSGEIQTASLDKNISRTLSRGAISGWPMIFESLPGTLEEAKAINGIEESANVVLLLRDKASETSLKQISRPNTLHLATHGFFLEDKERNIKESEKERGVGGVSLTEGQPIFKGNLDLQNPLLRSGLALAGANRLADNAPIPEGEDDGILTAMEVTGMELYGTDLVVLSACETGLGEVQRGEGVAGLRRAFKIAGAENIIMSLWSVPDEETVWLMEEFYRHYFKGAKPAVALNKARTFLRKKLIERDGIDHPYYWAAFILEGSTL